MIWILEAEDPHEKPPTLGTIVGTFKTLAARAINEARGTRGEHVWQRGYYEHIIRGDRELERIREYILANPSMCHTHETDDMKGAWSAARKA